jgi:hypothetical protein
LVPMGAPFVPVPHGVPIPQNLPRNPPPLEVTGPAQSIGSCYRGLGRDCPPILTIK